MAFLIVGTISLMSTSTLSNLQAAATDDMISSVFHKIVFVMHDNLTQVCS